METIGHEDVFDVFNIKARGENFSDMDGVEIEDVTTIGMRGLFASGSEETLSTSAAAESSPSGKADSSSSEHSEWPNLRGLA